MVMLDNHVGMFGSHQITSGHVMSGEIKTGQVRSDWVCSSLVRLGLSFSHSWCPNVSIIRSIA